MAAGEMMATQQQIARIEERIDALATCVIGEIGAAG
jgi:hypothetical protein